MEPHIWNICNHSKLMLTDQESNSPGDQIGYMLLKIELDPLIAVELISILLSEISSYICE